MADEKKKGIPGWVWVIIAVMVWGVMSNPNALQMAGDGAGRLTSGAGTGIGNLVYGAGTGTGRALEGVGTSVGTRLSQAGGLLLLIIIGYYAFRKKEKK